MSAIKKPTKFAEAIRKLGSKTPLAVALSSEQWQTMPDDIRDNAFFTANVSSAKMLTQLKGKLMTFLEQTKEMTRSGETSLAVGGRSDFVAQMQDWALKNGMGDPLPPGVGRGERGLIPEIKDIASNRRLKLIFDTQIRQSYAKGSLKFSTQPEIVNTWPAWRFVRDGYVKEARGDHSQHEGEVRLKSDDAYWAARNKPSDGGFGVPHGPWGFNSQMGVEEVSRTEAIRLGLIDAGANVKTKGLRFKEGVRDRIDRMDPEMVNRLTTALGDKVEVEGNEIRLKA